MYSNLAKILPKGLRNRYLTNMMYADVRNRERAIGFLMMLSVVLAAVASIFLSLIFFLPIEMFLLSIGGLFLFFQGFFYIMVVFKADGKSKLVESVLPDALLLMSMNIKSGMTTDRALIMAAITEFGPLEKELNRAGKQLLAGKEIREALLDMTTRIKSKQLDRTVRLIIEGVESGGELSNLLLQTAEDIQNTKLIQNEVRANVMMYMIFIFFAAGIGAPLLFGISTYLVGALTQQFSTFQSTGASTFITGTAANVSPGFLMIFALVSLSMTSFFGGLIMGIVKGGSEKEGLKIIPILLFVSLTVFFVVRIIVAGILPSP